VEYFSSMARILIVYHSQSGNTQRMAEAIAKGAGEIENTSVALKGAFETTLKDLIDLARLSASAANRQPLKYMLSNEKERNAVIFSTLKWAAYLKDWDGPEEGERPAAYIIVLGDTQVSHSFGCDHGIASQNVLLGATEMGLGGCIVAVVEVKYARQLIENMAEKYYQPRNLPVKAEIITPVGGLCIMD